MTKEQQNKLPKCFEIEGLTTAYVMHLHDTISAMT